MVSEEVKETIYIAIGCIIAAAVLALLAFVLQLRGDFANAYNEQKAAQLSTERYVKYSAYQDRIIYGDELIALIRDMWCGDVTICIDEIFFGEPNSSNYQPSGTRYTGVANWDKSNGYIILTPARMRAIETELGKVVKGTTTRQANKCYYDLEDLMYSPRSTLCGSKRVDPNSAYYCYLVTGEHSDSELVSLSYNKSLDYQQDISAIVIRHIRYDSYPGVFKTLKSIDSSKFTNADGYIAVDSLVRSNTTLMNSLRKIS